MGCICNSDLEIDLMLVVTEVLRMKKGMNHAVARVLQCLMIESEIAVTWR